MYQKSIGLYCVKNKTLWAKLYVGKVQYMKGIYKPKMAKQSSLIPRVKMASIFDQEMLRFMYHGGLLEPRVYVSMKLRMILTENVLF